MRVYSNRRAARSDIVGGLALGSEGVAAGTTPSPRCLNGRKPTNSEAENWACTVPKSMRPRGAPTRPGALRSVSVLPSVRKRFRTRSSSAGGGGAGGGLGGASSRPRSGSRACAPRGPSSSAQPPSGARSPPRGAARSRARTPTPRPRPRGAPRGNPPSRRKAGGDRPDVPRAGGRGLPGARPREWWPGRRGAENGPRRPPRAKSIGAENRPPRQGPAASSFRPDRAPPAPQPVSPARLISASESSRTRSTRCAPRRASSPSRRRSPRSPRPRPPWSSISWTGALSQAARLAPPPQIPTPIRRRTDHRSRARTHADPESPPSFARVRLAEETARANRRTT